MTSHFSSLLFVLHLLQAIGGLLDCILIGSFQASSPGHSKSQGGKRKESLKLLLWNLNICIWKSQYKNMLIGGDDISNDVITPGTCFSMFVYIRTHFHFVLIGGNLTA